MTPDQVEANSVRRARRNKIRMYLVAGFVLVALMFGAALLQVQQNRLAKSINMHSEYVMRMCEQRRANTIKTNENWEALAVIERRNKFIDEDIRQARLKVYDNAKLVVPDCG